MFLTISWFAHLKWLNLMLYCKIGLHIKIRLWSKIKCCHITISLWKVSSYFICVWYLSGIHSLVILYKVIMLISFERKVGPLTIKLSTFQYLFTAFHGLQMKDFFFCHYNRLEQCLNQITNLKPWWLFIIVNLIK